MEYDRYRYLEILGAILGLVGGWRLFVQQARATLINMVDNIDISYNAFNRLMSRYERPKHLAKQLSNSEILHYAVSELDLRQ